MNIKWLISFSLNILPLVSFSQTDIDKALRGSELLLNGLSFLKSNKSDTANSKTVESVCVKNKLSDKITLVLLGKDEDNVEIKKELIIQKGSKECLFEVPRGIYTYQIVLANQEVFKKGEYKRNPDYALEIYYKKK
ncbi:MAG: hypothetical protein CFE24_01360 [Flavobacterium sp. BFFFF2]|nr:MAG: hypothetical protein CFE24_01360 [Flavobacterium sp. BFFFF2]